MGMACLCSVMSGPQLGRPEGWDDSVSRCINDLEVPSLVSFFGARMTSTLSSAGPVNQSLYIETICVTWASSQHGGQGI